MQLYEDVKVITINSQLTTTIFYWSNSKVISFCSRIICIFLFVISMDQFVLEIAATEGFQLGLDSQGIPVLGA